MSEDLYKPGEITPNSGQYQVVGPRGGDCGGSEVTLVEGKPLPPTLKPGQRYTLVDKTNHKSK